MLDDYKDGQVIFYNVLSMAIKNNKISKEKEIDKRKFKG